MPSFADSFWSTDYSTGLGVLQNKLAQGITENHQLLTIASLRADAEEVYAEKLGNIAPSVDKLAGNGFSRDDGASTRKAYEGVRGEMLEASKNHAKIATTIRDLVVAPFGKWSREHKMRVQTTKEEVDFKIKEHSKQSETVKKLRAQYFNKCRLLEDLEEEQKLAFQPTENQSPKHKPPTLVLPEISEEEVESAEIADVYYPPDRLKEVLGHMISNMPLREHKVAILGSYQNVATGAEFVEYFQKHLNASTVSYAERIGQDMTDLGYLRLVGQVGSTFANSSRMNYQIRPKAFEIAKVQLPKKPILRTSTFGSMGSRSGSFANEDFAANSPVNAVAELIQGWNPLNNPHPNETPVERLRREASEADERYKAAVRKLDRMRCALEEEMIEYLKFMERCELDRLKAIKTVILDFSGAIGNVLPTMQSTVDQMMLFQETIQPLGDLRYLLENYRTGAFVPHVTPYENYYGIVEDQTFGVDLEARARADKKRVPIIVTNILTFLDERYPSLEGDEARRMIWLAPVPLRATHHLRNAINNGQAVPSELLEKYEIPVVASVLKLYLLELPDSIVSCQLYEIVRSAYSSAAYATEEARVKILQGTLANLRLNNIATLDVILTHFVRLIDLTSADEEYVTALTQTLAPCIIRPRQENDLSMGEKWSAKLLKDLFTHKDEIFEELKRQSHGPSGSGRPRALSTDERNRRANQEARAKAIASKSRGASPAASMRHRRDRSRGSEGSTRFPINVGSVASPPSRTGTGTTRNSLEVPSSITTLSPPPADEVAGGDGGGGFPGTGSNAGLGNPNIAAAVNGDGEKDVMSAAAPSAADGEGAAEGGAGAGTAGLDDDSTGRAATLSKLNSNESTGSGSNAPATTEISLSDDINDTAAPTTDHERPVSGHGSIHTAGADRPTSLYSSGASGRSSPVVVEKRNSLTRSGHANRVSSLRSKFQRKESQEGSVSEQPEEKVPAAEPEGQRGVTLTDAPMDDDF